MLKRSLAFLLAFVVIIATVLLVNTFRFHSKQNTSVTTNPTPPLPDSATGHLQQLIRFKTISCNDPAQFDSTPFMQLHRYLQHAYPLVHQQLTKEVINQYTLLYHWKGKDTNLAPLLLMAHQDVVPVEAVNLSDWQVPPFDGVVKDSCIWGRGAWDDKINLASMLEATERLLQQGAQPTRSVYFLFSHDEELTGKQGTQVAAHLFRERGIRPWLVLDEGGIVTTQRVPGMQKPVALLGTAEKGYLTLQLEVKLEGGHSSMPAAETAIDVLTTALRKLRRHPFKARLAPAQEDFVRYLGPEMPFLQRMVFANRWLFESLLIKQYEKTPTGNALMRTTIAPTMVNAGIKENIVPSVATATVNFRLLTGDSCRWATEQVKAIIDDPRVRITVLDQMEASASTAVSSAAYQQVETAVRKTFPQTIVTPFLVVGATDSHHFQALAEHIIRFTPAIDPQNFHGVNERVSLRSYQLAIGFYEELLRK